MKIVLAPEVTLTIPMDRLESSLKGAGYALIDVMSKKERRDKNMNHREKMNRLDFRIPSALHPLQLTTVRDLLVNEALPRFSYRQKFQTQHFKWWLEGFHPHPAFHENFVGNVLLGRQLSFLVDDPTIYMSKFGSGGKFYYRFLLPEESSTPEYNRIPPTDPELFRNLGKEAAESNK